ncbi:hypothetical protein BY996DRAFT_6415512 [Phakopsora pachyrhizi]|nr:hypothetical protein BY996DRAFT_6415512 [Phakopsora pachyrhizi]
MTPQRKKKFCTNSDDAILQPESKFVSTLTCTTIEELEMHDFIAQFINELVDQLKQQARSNEFVALWEGKANPCAPNLKLRTAHSFKTNSAKNQSTPAVKSNFEQNLDLLAGYQKENKRALIELGQAKSRILKVLNLLSKACGPDWKQMIILKMTGSSGSNHQIVLENSQPLQSIATKIKDEEERIEELIKDENN